MTKQKQSVPAPAAPTSTEAQKNKALRAAPMEGDELVTATELAKELRLESKTLHNWRSAGRGPKFLKLGGRVVYPRSEIEAFKASCLRQSTSAPSGASATPPGA